MSRTEKRARTQRQSGTTLAYAYRSGQIGFIDGPGSMPDGALYLGSGPQDFIHELISGCCRHAYDGVTLLVPGIPEAESDEAAYAAFMRFFERIQERLVKGLALPGHDKQTEADRHARNQRDGFPMEGVQS